MASGRQPREGSVNGACVGKGTLFAVISLLWTGGASAQGVLDAQTGGNERALLPLVSESLRIEIDHQHASTTLDQVFENQIGSRVEGQYHLRTGGGSRMEGFTYWNGDQKVVGEVFERGAAQEVYRVVTTQRRDPGLLEQQGDGEFSFRIFPIEAGERKRVQTRFSQFLSRHGRSVEYRVPLGRSDARIDIELLDQRPLTRIASSTHRIEVDDPHAGRHVVRVLEPIGNPTELVLTYEVDVAAWSVAGLVHRDPGHDAFVVVTLATPDELPAGAIVAKDVTIVLDRSGSMAGEPIENARRAAIDIIRRLPPTDRVNFIAFDTGVDALFDRPRPMGSEVLGQALAFAERVRSGGGTNIAIALERAIAAQESGTERPRVILFLTDGQSDAQAALRVAADDPGDARVFTIGVGSGVNQPFLSRLAAVKRGRYTFVDSAEAIVPRMAALYSQIESPVLVGISLEVTGATLTGAYPRSLPDLFVNDELRIVGRLTGQGAVRVILRGRDSRGRPVAHQTSITVPERARRSWVGRLWAQARVDDLLEEIALNGESTEVVDEVINLSLAYDFVTPYTAMLAIPESEITWEAADTLEAARQQRQRALAANPEAMALSRSAGSTIATGAGGDVAGSSAEPMMAEETMATVGSADDGDIAARAGCASCAVGAESRRDGTWLLALLVLVALWAPRLRRRR